MINSFFDKIFYINLDKDVERDEKITAQFQKFNITNYERISATKIDIVPDPMYWRNFNKDKLTENYILGSLGCRNSHYRIMELSLQRGYNKILVLEDDVIIKEDPSRILEANKNELENWDMLYFGGIIEENFQGQIVTTHAYAVNRKLIEEIYFMLPSSGMEVDNFYAKILYHMSYNYSHTGKYLIKKLNPFNTIIQDYSYKSNIS